MTDLVARQTAVVRTSTVVGRRMMLFSAMKRKQPKKSVVKEKPRADRCAYVSRKSWWHSEASFTMALIDTCPWCGAEHYVCLASDEDHAQLPHEDYSKNVEMPCGCIVDLIFLEPRRG